jgi:rhodanese-related sulfurtransferase
MIRTRQRKPSRQHGYVERIVYQMLVIIGICIFLAGANMLANPRSPHYGQGQLREGEIRLSDIPGTSELLWVDARNQVDYDDAHIKGAILVNESLYYVQVANFLSVYNGRQTVLVYCSSEGCDAAAWVADRLRKETGAKDVHVIFGGWEEIQKTNLPLESRRRN